VDGVLVGERTDQVGGFVGDVVHGDRFQRQGQPASLDRGDVEDLVDQPEQVLGA